MAAENVIRPRQAMVLAAGVGHRLRPLTEKRPKVLAPVANCPVINGTIHRLRRTGCERLVVNVHHLAGQVEAFLDGAVEPGLEIKISREDEILGTGGGLGKAKKFFDLEPLILINGDILTNLDLAALWNYHHQSGNWATLAVQDHPDYNQVAVDGDGRLMGISDRLPGGSADEAVRVAFTGIHVLGPEMFEYLPGDRPASIIDIYLDLVSMGKPVGTMFSQGHYWLDIGTPANYLRAHGDLAAGLFDPLEVLGAAARLPDVGPGTKLGEGTSLLGATVVGKNCRIGDGVSLINTVVWDDVEITPGIRLENCVLGDGCRVTESATDKVFA
ncbi:sugar phosphate nucleotidyltransferase [candidate division KSB1 bacterium]